MLYWFVRSHFIANAQNIGIRMKNKKICFIAMAILCFEMLLSCVSHPKTKGEVDANETPNISDTHDNIGIPKEDKTNVETPRDGAATDINNEPNETVPVEPFLLGIERIDEYAHLFSGKRVGLITNATGIDKAGRSSIDILYEKVNLVALFSPEHGIRGSETAGKTVSHSIDKKTGLPVYSLYGNTKRPTTDMLRKIDVLCFDIQDVGARFYTYIWTLCYAMEACAENNVEVVVFDRPNPIGNTVEGAILQLEYRSFVGYLPIAQRHGMTVGELAYMFQKEFKIHSKLTIISMQGYEPAKYFSEYPLMWIPTSPNIPHAETAIVYSGMCLFEGVNLSVGRGTTMPFEYIGAPYIDAEDFSEKLNALNLEGVFFYPAYFTPTDSLYKGVACNGIQVIVTDKNKFKSVKTAVQMFALLKKDYPSHFKITDQGYKLASINLLSGTNWFTASDFSAEHTLERMENDVARFEEQRKPYLLYE